MKKEKLEALFQTLTLEEKIGQVVQVSGNVYMEDKQTIDTGPLQDIGFHSDFQLDLIGSVYNVNDWRQIKKIQTEYLHKHPKKIPLLIMADVIYGFRTINPIPLAQAGSFDFELIQKGATETAKESYRNGLHVLFSPMLDLVRDPRWGRVMESPGEDVYVASQYANSIVTGYQGELNEEQTIEEDHVAAGIKHFAAYGAPEAGREYNSVDMSLLKLRQTYLPPYEAALKANAKLVMTAFNLLNGIPATANKFLNRKILREENNFDGVLISDFAAIEELVDHGYAKDKQTAAQKALEAGVDIDMMTSCYANELQSLIESDQLPMELLDEAVRRILVLKNELGLFENPYRGLEAETAGEILTATAKQTAIELVEKSSVLLKNDQQLPLGKSEKLAVIGPYGTSKLTLGFWASVTGSPLDTISLAEGLQQHFPNQQLLLSKGYNLFDDYEAFGPLKEAVIQLNGPIDAENELVQEAVEKAKQADKILFTFGENFMESGEGASKAHLDLPEKQLHLLRELKKTGKPIVGILYTGRPLVLTEVATLFDSLLLVWYPGTMGGIGISNLLTGKANPSGRLAMTFPRAEGQIPIYYAHHSTGRPMGTSNQQPRFTSRYTDEANEPLYPFGYGLSYSSFQITTDSAAVHCRAGDTFSFKLAIQNTSQVDGEEVIQFYIQAAASEIVRPVQELVGSKRIFVHAKSVEEVEIEVDSNSLGYVNESGEHVLEKGSYRYLIATSSDNVHKSISIVIE